MICDFAVTYPMTLSDIENKTGDLQKNLFFFLYLAAVDKLEPLINASRLKHIIAVWHVVAKDSRRTKKYFRIFVTFNQIIIHLFTFSLITFVFL